VRIPTRYTGSRAILSLRTLDPRPVTPEVAGSRSVSRQSRATGGGHLPQHDLDPQGAIGFWREESRGEIFLDKRNDQYPPVKLGHQTEWFLVGTITKIDEALLPWLRG
jgi:hypothetical protein